MDDNEDLSEARKALIGSLGPYEQYLPERARKYERDPLMDIVERNLLGGFDRETPAVIEEIAEQFRDVLEMAQWAGFVDEGASFDSLADAFDSYKPDPADNIDWPAPTRTATLELSLVAGLIRRARGRLEPKRVKLGDGREITVGFGFQHDAALAAFYLVTASSRIYGAIQVRQNAVSAASSARREFGQPTREKVFKMRDEIKARDPLARKEKIAWEVSAAMDLSFEHVRKLLREPKGE